MTKQEHLKSVLYCRAYDPDDVKDFLKKLEVEITLVHFPPTKGWSLHWQYGGGIICPEMPREEAEKVVAMYCYLYLTGVEVGLCSSLAYWFFRHGECNS